MGLGDPSFLFRFWDALAFPSTMSDFGPAGGSLVAHGTAMSQWPQWSLLRKKGAPLGSAGANFITLLRSNMVMSENRLVPLNPMVNDHSPY